MDFPLKKREHRNIPKYNVKDFDLAQKFANLCKKELGELLRSVVLFGSTARDEKPINKERDIDILLIINDLSIVLGNEVIQTYRVIVENCASKVSRRLHINTLKLTTFWEYVRNGDPIATNMLRDGVPLIDDGIFEPAQELLLQGRIRPSKEAIWTYFARAPATMHNADWHVLQASIDLYWAVVDSAHAALMNTGAMPPTPAHIADLMREHLVRTGRLAKKYADTMEFFYKLQKQINYRQVQRISGKEYDHYHALADDFVKTMQKFVELR